MEIWKFERERNKSWINKQRLNILIAITVSLIQKSIISSFAIFINNVFLFESNRPEILG